MANPITGGTWGYNIINGEIKHFSIVEWMATFASATWIGFPTEKEAKDYAAKHPIKGNPVDRAAGGVANAAKSVTSDVLKPLFQANIWIRVGEVALGIVLIAVGLARLTNAVPIATKIAGIAGKAAVL